MIYLSKGLKCFISSCGEVSLTQVFGRKLKHFPVRRPKSGTEGDEVVKMCPRRLEDYYRAA